MIKVLNKELLGQLEASMGKGIYTGYTLEKMQREAPDFHFYVQEGEEIRGCCSVWKTTGMKDQEGNVAAAIGHFEAVDELSAKEVLEAACHQLQKLGEDYVIAPVDGSTWNSYRLVTASDGSGPFLMEPPSKTSYSQWLQSCGFAPRYEYFSTKEKIDVTMSHDVKETGDYVIEAVDLVQLEHTLDQIYEISLASFKDNLFYKPIEREAFKAMYRSYKQFLIGDLILIAKRGDQPIGFIFAIPNYLDATSKSLIIKTIAVVPAYQKEGIGKKLYEHILEKASVMGFTEAITALIYKGNHSRKLCEGAQVMRAYSLFRKELGHESN